MSSHKSSLYEWNHYFNTFVKPKTPSQEYSVFSKEVPNEIYSMDFVRHDWTGYPTFIVDPSGCQDADDAFSIWEDLSDIHLMVHIADPTAWFSPFVDDPVFQYVLKNGTTFYMSGNEPNHMFHSSILDLAKLNADGPRRVISVHSILSKDDFTIKSSEIEFGWIQTTSKQRLTYQEASVRILTEPVLSIGTQITKAFRLKRTHDSAESKALSELSTAYPLVSPEGTVSLVTDTPEVRLVKSMIAEFAIHSNQVFAEEIEKGGSAEDTVFRRAILTRVSDKKEEDQLGTGSESGSGLLIPEEVIAHIIRSGKSATYTTDKIPHELVNTEAYTHATSPIRRAPDCVVHFLIKSSKLALPRPFTNLQLKTWSDDLTRKQKTSKNLGFSDSKCRYLQYMSQILESKSPVVNIHYKVISYSNGFVNIHINSLNEYPIHMTYTIRRSYKTFPEHLQENDVRITRVNVPSKFDEGTLPELDRIFPVK